MLKDQCGGGWSAVFNLMLHGSAVFWQLYFIAYK